MTTRIHYDNICSKALEIQKQLNLTPTQTLLYNHICRGDFYLRNGDGQCFYDINHGGFGYFGSREWMRLQMKKLVSKNIVKFDKIYDCRDPRCTSWVWYDSRAKYENLIDAGRYSSCHALAMVRYYLNLPDWFPREGKVCDELYIEKNKNGMTFKYKNIPCVYTFDYNLEGNILEKQSFIKTYKLFDDMIYDICSFMLNDGYKKLIHVQGYTNLYIHKQKLLTLSEINNEND